jgi:hypothetical protein
MFSRLFNHFILRRMAQERARTITTVIGIALGIAVVLAIQLTNASSVRGFEAALTSVAGRTSVEILGTGGIDETRLPDLGWLREFGAMSPVIEGEMAIVTGGGGQSSQASTTETLRAEGRRVPRSEAVKVLGRGHPPGSHPARLRASAPGARVHSPEVQSPRVQSPGVHSTKVRSTKAR